MSLYVLRPRLPLRRTLPGGSPIVRGSALLVLDGLLQGEVQPPGGGPLWRGQLTAGFLLDLPREGRHQLRATGTSVATVLLIEPRAQGGRHEQGEPFTPFVDG